MVEVEPIHAVVEIARANYGKIPMAVASGGTQPIIVGVLEHLKIRHLFDAVVTSEMVQNQKPAPDIFLEAARRIGVDPKLPRLRRHGFGNAGDSFGGNGRGGCAGITARVMEILRPFNSANNFIEAFWQIAFANAWISRIFKSMKLILIVRRQFRNCLKPMFVAALKWFQLGIAWPNE